MTGARRRALSLILIGIAVAIVTGIAAVQSSRRGFLERSRVHPPKLLLLTSLPLLFGDGLEIASTGSAALRRLESRYVPVPISTTDPSELAKGRLLLMAQPQAQTADNLVSLDQWVRNGGKLMLLADPVLEWPSSQPLGDVTRPLAMFMDTGLLKHWGIRLDPPERRGAAQRRLGPYTIITASPGVLSGQCRISPDKLVARCTVGAGEVTIVADADFLDVEALGPAAGKNLDGLLFELAVLEQP